MPCLFRWMSVYGCGPVHASVYLGGNHLNMNYYSHALLALIGPSQSWGISREQEVCKISTPLDYICPLIYSLQLNYFGRFLSIFQSKRWQLDPDKFGLVRTLRRLIDLIVSMITRSWMGQGCLNDWGDCKILPCILFSLEYLYMRIIHY